jgi:hypothetical protein
MTFAGTCSRPVFHIGSEIALDQLPQAIDIHNDLFRSHRTAMQGRWQSHVRDVIDPFPLDHSPAPFLSIGAIRT